MAGRGGGRVGRAARGGKEGAGQGMDIYIYIGRKSVRKVVEKRHVEGVARLKGDGKWVGSAAAKERWQWVLP